MEQKITEFEAYLREKEKSVITIEKYLRDVRAFFAFAGNKELTKDLTLEYKQNLLSRGYAPRSVNSMLASLNGYFEFIGRPDCRARSVKLQKEVYCPAEKELTKAEYERLVNTAIKQGKETLSLILQTICGTGIRVSELQFITAESVKTGEATVACKGKTRKVFIVPKLQKLLQKYIQKNNIRSGPVFISKTGKPLNRTVIWREMKSLCKAANVNPTKVFPHNLRHLFARVFYKMEKDIALLADILGHSSINTTRIYIVSSGEEHRRRMEKMKLVI